MVEQKRLKIQRTMSPRAAAKIVEILVEMPDGPTMTIQRGEQPGQSVVFFSKRTYDWLEQKLREMKLEGVL